MLIVDHLCQSRYLADITRESNISPPPSDEQQVIEPLIFHGKKFMPFDRVCRSLSGIPSKIHH